MRHDSALRAHLTLPFGLMGLVGAWLTGDYFRLRLSGSDASARGTLTLLVPAAAALLGLVLSARAVARRPWVTWLTTVVGTIAAGIVIGVAASPLDWTRHVDREAVVSGAATSLAFLPVVAVTVVLARRVGRARAGSLVDAADRRAPWLVVATGVAAAQILVARGTEGLWRASTSQEVSSALGVLSVLSLATMAGLNFVAIARARRALGSLLSMRPRDPSSETTCDDIVDVGVGDDEYEELEPGGSGYRTNERPFRIVRGDPGQAIAFLRRAVIRSTVCCFVAILGLFVAHDIGSSYGFPGARTTARMYEE